MNKAARKRQFKVIFANMHGQFQLFSPLVVNSKVVVLEFAGVSEEFRWEEDELVRVDNGFALEANDSRALHMLANDLRHACLTGYKNTENEPFSYLPSDEFGPAAGRPRDRELLTKTRKTILYQEYLEDYGSDIPRYLDLVKVTADRAEIRLANYYHQFVYLFRVAKFEGHAVRLPRDYFAFLCVFAYSAMKAVFRGYHFERTAKPKAKKSRESYRQLRLNL